MFLKTLLSALSLLSSSPANTDLPVRDEEPAAINLTAIHAIYCSDGVNIWQGTGFLIAKNTVATANHVQGSHCIDATTNTPLKTYKTDKRHDFALMTGDVPLVGPYIKYACERPTPKDYYISYGQSSVGMPSFFSPILRNNPLKATKVFDSKSDDVEGFASSKGMRIYLGAIASGMSGGPVASIFGTVYAINNAGDNKDSLLFDLADTGLCTGKWDS